jgi:uncharacterized phiE125 gp8 family phage protein
LSETKFRSKGNKLPFSLYRTGAYSFDVVTLARVKEHLRVGGTDEDALITAWISEAIETCQVESGIVLAQSQWEYRADGFETEDDGCTIRIPAFPIVGLSDVTYLASGSNSAVSYNVDNATVGTRTGRIYLPGGWPEANGWPECVQIPLTLGFPSAAAVPAQCVSAILLTVGNRYEHRGDALFGTQETAKGMPQAAKDLLRQVWRGNLE